MRRVLCAYLLWLPPFGWLGLHQCYLGRHYHAVWIFTTFAGFFFGWFRDLRRIPSYVNAPELPEEVNNTDTGCCCCGAFTRLMQCIRNCLRIVRRGEQKGKTLSNDVPEKEEDLSDNEDLDPASNITQKPQVHHAEIVAEEPKVVVKKVIEELVEAQLRKEFEKDGDQPMASYEINEILQNQLKSKIDELIQDSLSTDSFEKLLQNKPINEEEIKHRLEVLVKHSFKELMKTVERKKPIIAALPCHKPPAGDQPLTAVDQPCSDNEEEDNKEIVRKRRGKSNPAMQKGSLRVLDNIERVLAVFVTARYYRGLVMTAVSDYLETGWIMYCILQLLPSVGMMCGVYLVSNIGKPPRLTLSALLLSGLIGEASFGIVAEIIYGKGMHVMACLVCTSVAVYCWEWPANSESAGKHSRLAVALCACVAMTLIWGSIVMNTPIEVDGDNITISEAMQNFYHSPAWSQMKIAIWDTLIMYMEGNWDEANETLLRMSDLSGAERALSVLGLPRDANQAAVKARYRELAREWHPDKYQGEDKEVASNKFIEIQQAYTLLTKKIRA